MQTELILVKETSHKAVMKTLQSGERKFFKHGKFHFMNLTVAFENRQGTVVLKNNSPYNLTVLYVKYRHVITL